MFRMCFIDLMEPRHWSVSMRTSDFDDQRALSTREPTRMGVTVHGELKMDIDVKRRDGKVSIEEKRTDLLDSWTGTCWIYEYGVL